MKKKSRFFIFPLAIMAMLSLLTNSCVKEDNNNSNPIPTAQTPVLTTQAVSIITDVSAVCGGYISAQGGSAVTARGVCWSTTQNPTTASNYTTDSSGVGNFSSNITGLTHNITYYVRAYATNSAGTAYGSDVSFTTIGSAGGQPCIGFPTVSYGGQVYNTVQIGTQCWFKENLNIGVRVDVLQYQSDNGIIEKYCYKDSTVNCDIYGGLYNWFEMMNYTTTEGTQGICPSGWHLPSDLEWTTLTDFLGGLSYAGGKMKETGTAHWEDPNFGATNESGFTGLGGGYRDYNNQYSSRLFITLFWSSTEDSSYDAWYRTIGNTYEGMYNSNGVGKSAGLSVRCLKN